MQFQPRDLLGNMWCTCNHVLTGTRSQAKEVLEHDLPLITALSFFSISTVSLNFNTDPKVSAPLMVCVKKKKKQLIFLTYTIFPSNSFS